MTDQNIVNIAEVNCK